MQWSYAFRFAAVTYAFAHSLLSFPHINIPEGKLLTTHQTANYSLAGRQLKENLASFVDTRNEKLAFLLIYVETKSVITINVVHLDLKEHKTI